MKKTKRLLSALTALTITASAFAGLAIPASAEGGETVKTAIVCNEDGTWKIVSDKAQSAVLIQASYNDDSTLSDVKVNEVQLAEGDNSNFDSITITPYEKLMLWSDIDGEGSLIPLCDAVKVPEPIVGTIYINEKFDSYEAGQIIKANGNDKEAAPDPVTKGDIKYTAGYRSNATAINDSASITEGGELYIYEDIATNGRGIGMTFADSANIPAVAELVDGEVLELSAKVKATQTFTVVGFGTITKEDLTTTTDYVKIRAILDKSANKQYLIVTDTKGKVLSSRIAALTATTFTGLTFYDGTGSYYIDDLRVVSKTADTGILNFTVTDSGDESSAGLAEATVSIGNIAFTTGSDGTLSAALPNGTYTVAASKAGYEHTAEKDDADTKSVTVNSDTQNVNLSLQVKTYIKIPETVTIKGGQDFIAAPKTDDTATTSAFTIEVLDQYGIPMTSDEYGLAWSIYPTGKTEADPNVTIDNTTGIVTVSKSFSAEDNIAKYDVTAVAATADRNQKVTKTLCIGNNDVIYYEPANWTVKGDGSDKTHRLDTYSLKSELPLPNTSSVNLNVAFAGLGSDGNSVSTLGLVTEGGNFVGLQYTKEDKIIAWSGWKNASTDMNTSGSLGNYTYSADLVTNYVAGTKLNVSFVIDKVSGSITVSCNGNTVPLIIPSDFKTEKLTGIKTGHYRYYAGITLDDVLVVEPDENYLSINGDVDFAKISGKSVERTYTLGQSVIVPDETFDWTVEDENENIAPTGVSIEDGVLSVADTATAGTYTITATSKTNTDKTATFDVEIGDFQTITNDNAVVTGPRAYELGKDTTGTYAIEKALDSYGDDVAALLPAAVWSSSNTGVATIDPATGELTVVGTGTTTITATITNGTATSSLTVPVTVGTYSIVSDTVSTSVDISSLVTSDKITGYQVTVADASGNKLAQDVVQASAGSVAVPTYTGTAAKVEVAPVFEYTVGAPGTIGNVGAGYDIAIPANTYNFTVTANGDRSDVYVNSQLLVNNILQGGNAVKSLEVNDIVVNEGIAKITTADYANGSDENKVNISVKVVKSPSIVNRTRKMYVLGDSLVCIYYNGGNAENNAQTGWGQVLQNYITDDVEVVDLGNSGVTANGLYGSAFTQVLTSAKPGDIMVLESGYNDRTYDTEEIMKTALTNMYNEAKAKNVDVVFVSPNASQHDYSANVVWTTRMEDVATELSVPYIDLSQKSYDFLYDKYGADFSSGSAVNNISKFYNVSDRLHSTFNGANKWASIVAGSLIDLGYSNIVNTDYTYTFTDGAGDTITCQAAASN